MRPWVIPLAAGLLVATVITYIVLATWYRRYRRRCNQERTQDRTTQNFYAGLLQIREGAQDSNPKHNSHRVANVWNNGYNYNHGYSLKAFSWTDHPSLIGEAVEHGWSTFAFTYMSSASFPAAANKFWDSCAGSSYGEGMEPEISWEIGSGTDYMQKMRLNPGLPAKKNMNLLPPVQSLQAALPLPGPPLGALSFPQEAYFETTILAEYGPHVGALCPHKSFAEGEDVKLIAEPISSDDLQQHAEMKPTNSEAKKSPRVSSKGSEVVNNLAVDPAGHPKVMSVGLAVGGAPSYRLPGCEPGSIGFHSTGYVFLNGMAHVDGETEQHNLSSTKRAWGAVNTVIGCGFDPENRRVYYTLNGKQVYSLTCKLDEFSNPLYPIIAANYDVTVLVNLGQSAFEYAPANDQRVADPCFKRPLFPSPQKLPGAFYEDSGDLFSMGKLDSQWLANVDCSNSHDVQNKRPPSEGESEFFEIVLDRNK